eukprot:6178391-Pleurochrysis_carterae.AAC.6
MDVAGEQQIDVVSNIIKTRRTLAGEKIDVELDELHMKQKFADKCMPCYPQVRAPPWAPLRSEAENACARSAAEGVGRSTQLRARGRV